MTNDEDQRMVYQLMEKIIQARMYLEQVRLKHAREPCPAATDGPGDCSSCSCGTADASSKIRLAMSELKIM